MAAPIVSRPPAATFQKEEATHRLLSAATAAQWAKWVVVLLVSAGVCTLLVVGIVTWQDQARTAKARELWDEVYKATKEKSERPEERVAALESVAEKVKGSIPHAYVLMDLASLYFDQAVDPARSPEERGAALKKATELYKLAADSEPYASNLFFGPLAAEGEALALEQAQDYDAAINLLEEKLPKLETQSHFLFNKLSAQLARLYWLRFQKKNDPKDREAARTKLTEILRTDESGAWRDQAEYIKSLVEKRGKALPDGTAVPAVKPPPPSPKPPEALKTPPSPDKKTGVQEPPKPEAKTEPKKDEAKKEDTKKDDGKKEETKKAE